MNIDYLRTFCEVAKWNSFTKAGEMLGYAQSSVTTQIKKLEEEFGTILFERWGGKIKLTEAGSELLEYTYKIINLVEEAKQTLSNQSELTGSLSIGTIESIAGFYLPPYLQAFKNKYPKVNLLLRQGICRDLLREIKEGKHDLALILDKKREDPDLEFVTLKEEELILVAKRDHHLLQRSHININDLSGEKLIVTEKRCSYREIIENLYKSHAVRFEYSIELESIEAIKRCVSFGLGIAFLPLMAVKEEVQNGELARVPFSHPEINLYLQLVYHKKKWIPQSMQKLIDQLLERQ